MEETVTCPQPGCEERRWVIVWRRYCYLPAIRMRREKVATVWRRYCYLSATRMRRKKVGDSIEEVLLPVRNQDEERVGG